jgi:low temperature requirement protein LtrA
MAEHLAERRELAFPWGYGHVAIFAALAVEAAGLELALMVSHENHLKISLLAVGWLVALPVVAFIVCLWALEAWAARTRRGLGALLVTALALTASPLLALTRLGAAGVVGAVALASVALTVWVVRRVKPS